MPKRMALICFLSLVMLMSILGNLLVMVAVCKDRQLRWDTAGLLFSYTDVSSRGHYFKGVYLL